MKNKIKKIVREEIRRQILFQNLPTYDNPLTLYPFYTLNETLLHSFPVERVAKYIKDFFKLEDYQLNISKKGNVDILNVYTNFSKIDEELIERAMNYLGWFLARPKLEHLKIMRQEYEEGKREDGNIVFQFEPTHQNDVTDEIKRNEKILKHLTPYYYVGKIKHIGFSPRTKNKQFGYPDRVYFLKGSIDDKELREIGENLDYNNESPKNHGKYAIITIDTSKLPDHVKLFYDPNFKEGVYTCHNIPPDVIIGIQEVQFKDWLKS